MSANHDPLLYARSFGDVYDGWYGEMDDPARVVEAFRNRLASGSALLELGSGTGRLAGPLASAGFEVIALDASIELLAGSPSGPHSVAADMAELAVRTRSVDGAFVAYNTLFNLAGAHLQAQCLREVRRAVRAGGVLAIEAFVAPAGAADRYGITIRDHPTRAQDRVAILTGPDPSAPGQIVGSHIELGSVVACRPWRLAYRSPSEIDVLADRAGFDLVSRTHGWGEVTFEPDDDRHVSWYRRR